LPMVRRAIRVVGRAVCVVDRAVRVVAPMRMAAG